MVTPQDILIGYRTGFGEMENYYEFMEGYLKKAIDDIEISIKEIKNEVRESLIDKGYDEEYLANQDEDYLMGLTAMGYDYHYYQDNLNEVKIIQSTFRMSFLIACYSNFEYQLYNICKEEQKKKSLKLGINDLSGKGIEQAKNYFSKVIGVDISIDKSWQEVINIQKIRNTLVHNNGFLESEKRDKQIENYISKRPDLSIVTDRITLSADYNKHVIKILYNFLKNLILKIDG
jgi:hypothetical protein